MVESLSKSEIRMIIEKTKRGREDFEFDRGQVEGFLSTFGAVTYDEVLFNLAEFKINNDVSMNTAEILKEGVFYAKFKEVFFKNGKC